MNTRKNKKNTMFFINPLINSNNTSDENIKPVLKIELKPKLKSKPKPWQFFLDIHTSREDIGWWRKSHNII